MLVDMPNSENKLKISWRHHNDPPLLKTVCVLGQMKDGESIDTSKATAVCSPKDQYNKETGRKVSLTRALQGWSRADRAKIWKAYFARNDK
jgi:hypothetical protein